MTSLFDYKPEEIDKIIALPLKIGLWISHMDDEEGDLDDARERKALLSVLKSFSSDENRSQLVHEIASEALKRQAKWKGWLSDPGYAMPDLTKTLMVIDSQAAPDDKRAFRSMLYDLGEAVALAYGEFGMIDGDGKALDGFFDTLIHRIRSKADEGMPGNVSASELEALEKLRAALKN